ncbi:mycofactocin biosynthesis glycosyltransferase MftF [Streptomyces sp. NBC_00988]|uniref:mycofactocin biosynthesis glycosyltransferase MftF n=1 Tax=Streptomyces sp. NBC_00988 TaxID=2903704 RepID=UPI0038708EDB|nr:mycofactocin biosynthesis glycosyltransferase MftF [Streptomyces sp. NBC_00988]
MTTTLPSGAVVEIGAHVRVCDGGRILVGGTPTRLVRLSERALRFLRDGRITLVDPPSARLAERLLALGMAHPVLALLPPHDPAEVTVVVPVRDRARELDRLLAGIGRRTQVIVVDDCSRDSAAVARVAASHSARLVVLPENRGPAAARNDGLRHVRTRYVAFADSDIVIGQDTIPMLLRHFHDQHLAVVAPRVLGLESRRAGANWIARYESARSSLDLGPHAALVHPRSRVSWVPSAFLLARTDALGPGFTESMRVGEDVDLVWRLAAEGRRVRYEPAVTVRHEHRTRFTDWLGRKAYYGSGAHALYERHGPAVAPAALTPWAAGAAVALLAQRRWSVPVAAVMVVWAGCGYRRKVPEGSGGPNRLAVRLTGLGLAATAEQTMGMLLRHWWPVTLAGCVFSARVRRAAALAAVTDGFLEYHLRSPQMDPVRFALARRLDDLAYGAGLWAGAVRARSVRSLLPTLRGPGHGSRTTR